MALCELDETVGCEAALWDFVCRPMDPSADTQVQARAFRTNDAQAEASVSSWSPEGPQGDGFFSLRASE